MSKIIAFIDGSIYSASICETAAWVAGRIDAPDSRVALAVVPTNEEAMIARYTLEVLRREGSATIAANPPAADANR